MMPEYMNTLTLSLKKKQRRNQAAAVKHGGGRMVVWARLAHVLDDFRFPERGTSAYFYIYSSDSRQYFDEIDDLQ